MGRLAASACSRMAFGLAPSTRKSYNSMFRLFVAFAVFMQAPFPQVTAILLLSFLEFLHFNGTSSAQMNNYLSAIKTELALRGITVQAFDDVRLRY